MCEAHPGRVLGVGFVLFAVLYLGSVVDQFTAEVAPTTGSSVAKQVVEDTQNALIRAGAKVGDAVWADDFLLETIETCRHLQASRWMLLATNDAARWYARLAGPGQFYFVH